MKLPDKLYEVLKWVSMIALNAVGQLYEELAKIWNWPAGPEIAKTCSILALTLGILIGISTYEYRKNNEEGDDE